MRSFLLTCLVFVLSFTNLVAQDKDSLFQAAIMHAAHNNIADLRPIYKEYGKTLPHHIQLYCQMVIARDEGRFTDMLTCIDSLSQWHPKQIKTKPQLSLAELKAEGLRQLGLYEELLDFCKSEIKKLKRKGLRNAHLKELYAYESKATRLLGNNHRSRLLQLADRNLPFELDSLYKNTDLSKVDSFTILRCKFTLAQAFHQQEELLQASSKLLVHYCDSLDTEELSECIQQGANILIQRGNWQALKRWTELAKDSERTHFAPIGLYKKLSASFEKYPEFSIKYNKDEIFIPSSYEWPLTISIKINQYDSTHFTLSTDQPYTLIDYDLARQKGVTLLEDTVFLTSSHGMLAVCPALIQQMSLGELQLNNVFAYAVLPSNNMPAPFACAIGLNEITAIGKITLYPEKIGFNPSKGTPNTPNHTGNLYLTQQGGLNLMGQNKEGNHVPLGVDFYYPNNIICKQSIVPEIDGSEPIVHIGESNYAINKPIFVEPKSRFYDGILGIPFIKQYKKVVFDFSQMIFSAEDKTDYLPVRGNFGYKTDKHYLNRNAYALACGWPMDPQEQLFLNLMIALGKTNRTEAAQICKRLREVQSDFYSPYTEAENLFLSAQYQAAATLAENILKGNHPQLYISENDKADLKKAASLYQLFKNEKPISLEGKGKITVENSDNPHTILINGKKITMSYNICSPLTIISAKTAKKRKVKILGTNGQTCYGLIKELDLGGILCKNLPCIIEQSPQHSDILLPDKGKGILLGFNVISQFQQITWQPQSVTFSTNASITRDGAKLYYDKKWYIETESQGTYPSYILHFGNNNYGSAINLTIDQQKIPSTDFTDLPQDQRQTGAGNISLTYLIQKFGTVTIDLKKMRLFLR